MTQLNLKGTEKQIAWATDLINDAMLTIEKNLELYQNGSGIVVAGEHVGERRRDSYDVYYVQAYTELKASLEKTIAKLETAAQVIDSRRILDPDLICRTAVRRANQLHELAMREQQAKHTESKSMAETTETKPETTETKTETPEAKTETKSETPAKAGKKIIIDGKEVSISEALTNKIYYRAQNIDIEGIFEDAAKEAAKKAADDKCDVDDLIFNREVWDEAYLTAYLKAAESDLIISTAEVERQEAEIAEREEAEALARIDMLP